MCICKQSPTFRGMALPLSLVSSSLLVVFDSEDEDITVQQIMGNYLKLDNS